MTPPTQKSHTNRPENIPAGSPAGGEVAQKNKNPWRQRAIPLLKLLLLLVAAALVWDYLHGQYGNDPRAWLEALRSTSPWLFIAVAAVLPAVGFPIAVCYLFAGAAFGFIYGWLYCLLGLALGISGSFVLARTLLRKPLEGLLESWARRIPGLSSRHHRRAVLLARIVPGLSFALQNPLLALLGIPFRTYFAYSMLAQGLLAMLMCAIGAAQRQSTTQTVTLAAVAIIGISALAHFGIYRGWRRGAVQENTLVNKT